MNLSHNRDGFSQRLSHTSDKKMTHARIKLCPGCVHFLQCARRTFVCFHCGLRIMWKWHLFNWLQELIHYSSLNIHYNFMKPELINKDKLIPVQVITYLWRTIVPWLPNSNPNWVNKHFILTDQTRRPMFVVLTPLLCFWQWWERGSQVGSTSLCDSCSYLFWTVMIKETDLCIAPIIQ